MLTSMTLDIYIYIYKYKYKYIIYINTFISPHIYIYIWMKLQDKVSSRNQRKQGRRAIFLTHQPQIVIFSNRMCCLKIAWFQNSSRKFESSWVESRKRNVCFIGQQYNNHTIKVCAFLFRLHRADHLREQNWTIWDCFVSDIRIAKIEYIMFFHCFQVRIAIYFKKDEI